MRNSILKNASAKDITLEPYPHLYVRNALPPEIASYLLEHFPTFEDMSRGISGAKGLSATAYPENKKFCMYGREITNNPALDTQVKEFFQYHASFEFFKEIFTLFHDVVERESPQVVSYVDSITPQDVSVAQKTDKEQSRFIIDGGLCIDTPARTPNLHPGVHLDNPKKICGVLLYLRPPEDKGVGGEFNAYGVPSQKIEIDPKTMVKKQYVPLFEKELKETIPYEHNSALIFFNSPKAFHGVQPRYGTDFMRYSMNIAFAANKPLHDFSPYAESYMSQKLRALNFYFKKLKG